MKGFALLFSVLFLLLLTLFGLAMLSMAESYYAATRHLLDDQNARIACEQATKQLVDRHNLGTDDPGLFLDPEQWTGMQLEPFLFNDFNITAELAAPWSATSPNPFTVTATKGPHIAKQQVQLCQRRFEHFALYSDSGSATLPGESLVDGLVFSREPLNLIEPGVQFREMVQADVTPEFFASFRKKTLQVLPYPEISDLMSLDRFLAVAQQRGLVVKGPQTPFWKANHYEIELDQFQITQAKKKWELRYKSSLIGTVSELIVYFDGPLFVRQSDLPAPTLPTKPEAPLVIVSKSTLRFSTAIHSPNDAAFLHPLCFISGEAIELTSELPHTVTIQASLIALGSETRDGEPISLVIDTSPLLSTPDQKVKFLEDFRASNAILHEDIVDSTTIALENDQQVVWIRGNLTLDSGISLPAELTRLHLQASRSIFPLIPALPFVYCKEGTQQWQ